jgi:hypothetical protein
MPGSSIPSSTIVSSPTICEKNVDVVELLGSPISYPHPSTICKPDVFYLCFKTNDCDVVSPRFEKHTTGVGS